ncbi:MAG: archease [Desulfurella sp.]|jgi:SHS2 domain-containing protein
MRKIIDYSSDIGLYIKSKNIESLIKEIIYGMFEYLVDKNKNLKSETKKTLSCLIEGNIEDGIVDVLNFFLKTFYIEKLIPYRIYIKKTNSGGFSIKALMGEFQGNLKNYIKAATYCENKITQNNNTLTFKVIFDV